MQKKPQTLSDIIEAMNESEYNIWIKKLASDLVDAIPDIVYTTEDTFEVLQKWNYCKENFDLISESDGQFTGGYYQEEYSKPGLKDTFVFCFDNSPTPYEMQVHANK